MKNKNKQYEEVEERMWDGMSKDNERERFREAKTMDEILKKYKIGKWILVPEGIYQSTIRFTPAEMEIISFLITVDSKTGEGCDASNQEIAIFSRKSRGTVSKALSKLREIGILKTRYKEEQGHKFRYLSIDEQRLFQFIPSNKFKRGNR